MSDKTDFKTKTVIKDKKGQYIMIKQSIQQYDIIFVLFMYPTQEHLNV